MKIAVIQLDTLWHDRAGNLGRIASLVGEAATKGAEMALLPEMCTSGFSMALEHAAEAVEVMSSPDSPGVQGLAEIARSSGVGILAGVALRPRGQELGTNAALLFDRSGAVAGVYEKLHPFSFAGEDKCYRAGQGPVVFEFEGVRLSAFICYDLRFPEVFRQVARQVQVMCVLANWPASRAMHWEALLKARAIENQCYVVGVNRIGIDGAGLQYAGGSRVYGPGGEVVVDCGSTEGPHVVDINIDAVAAQRERFPFLKDMR